MTTTIRFSPNVTYKYWLRLNCISDSREAWNSWCEHYFTIANMFPAGSPARQSCYDAGFNLRFVNTI